MSASEAWAAALGQTERESFSLHFDRLGLTARCRTLDAGEVEECRRMGGERGLRYALYLACPDLQAACEALKKQGLAASPLDITERLPYADVVAAGGVILSRSGASEARVRLEVPEEETVSAVPLAEGLSFLPYGTEERPETAFPTEMRGEALSLHPLFGAPSVSEEGRDGVLELARVFADRLTAAARNL